jgi:hypothetical protein
LTGDDIDVKGGYQEVLQSTTNEKQYALWLLREIIVLTTGHIDNPPTHGLGASTNGLGASTHGLGASTHGLGYIDNPPTLTSLPWLIWLLSCPIHIYHPPMSHTPSSPRCPLPAPLLPPSHTPGSAHGPLPNPSSSGSPLPTNPILGEEEGGTGTRGVGTTLPHTFHSASINLFNLFQQKLNDSNYSRAPHPKAHLDIKSDTYESTYAIIPTRAPVISSYLRMLILQEVRIDLDTCIYMYIYVFISIYIYIHM